MTARSAPARPPARPVPPSGLVRAVPLLTFLIVATLGLAAVLVARPVFTQSVAHGLSDEYDDIALNLVRSGRFSASPDDPGRETVTRGPVYPLYVAALVRLSGDTSMQIVGASDMVLHGITAALLASALVMFVTPGLALSGGLLYALWPTTLYYAGKGSSETMLTLWMVAAFLLLLRLVRAPSRATALGLGVALGFGCLTRGSGVVLLAVALAWTGSLILRRRAGAGVMAVLLVAWALTMSPWWVRNANLTDRFVPFHTLVWYNAFHDDRFDAAHRWLADTGRARVDWSDVPEDSYPPEVIRHPQGFEYPGALDARADLAQEEQYRSIMLEKFRSPAYLVRKVGRNVVDFWSASASVRKSRVLLGTSIVWLLMLVLGTAWAWPERRWRGPLIACHAVTWLTFALYLPFLSIFRHSIPTAPFIAFAITLGVARWRGRAHA